MAGVIPRPWHGKLISVARDIDAVLSQYLRGQILVMAILAAYYCLALWLADIPSSLSIGVFTGLLIFIPYLGFATGMILAECDPLVDEGLAYADRLRAAGVAVEMELYRGLTHDFIKLGRVLKEAGQAQQVAVEALKRAWA